MSKHGPTIEEEAREYAMALASAIGKWSDEQWRIGPWFMSIVLVARALADQLVAGELDQRLIDIMRSQPWLKEPMPNNEVPATWAPKPPAGQP